MIVNSSGQIAPRTVHDHALCPLRLNLRFGHGGRNGRCDGQPGQRRPALSQPAGSRAARPVPPCPLRTILTGSDPQKTARPTSLSSWHCVATPAGSHRGRWRGRDPGAVAGGGSRLAVAGGTPGPARRVGSPETAGGLAACPSAGLSLRKSRTHVATYRLEPAGTGTPNIVPVAEPDAPAPGRGRAGTKWYKSGTCRGPHHAAGPACPGMLPSGVR